MADSTVYGPDLENLGSCVRARRTELGLTQATLAERICWTQERVSTLEHGKYGLPSLPQLAALAAALDLPLTDLITACGYGGCLPTRPVMATNPPVAHHRRHADVVRTISAINERVMDARWHLEQLQDQQKRAGRITQEMEMLLSVSRARGRAADERTRSERAS